MSKILEGLGEGKNFLENPSCNSIYSLLMRKRDRHDYLEENPGNAFLESSATLGENELQLYRSLGIPKEKFSVIGRMTSDLTKKEDQGLYALAVRIFEMIPKNK